MLLGYNPAYGLLAFIVGLQAYQLLKFKEFKRLAYGAVIDEGTKTSALGS